MHFQDLGFEPRYLATVEPGLPGTGTVHQFSTGHRRNNPEGVVVRVNAGGSEWVGNFEGDDGGTFIACATPSPNHICVVSAGQAFVVNVNNPNDFEIVPISPVRQVLPMTDLQMLLLADDARIASYGPSGRLWRTGVLGSDELRINREGNLLTGEVWDAALGRVRQFRIDPASGEILAHS